MFRSQRPGFAEPSSLIGHSRAWRRGPVSAHLEGSWGESRVSPRNLRQQFLIDDVV